MNMPIRGKSGHRSETSPLTNLQRDILRTLLYFDIFDHPLTFAEVYAFLPSNSTSVAEISAACNSERLSGVLSLKHDFVFLATQHPQLPEERRRNEHRARRYRRIAVVLGTLIRLFPFVRGVFISGELSKGVARRDSDIDYFIVTAPRRLWVARSLLILFKKTVLLNQKKFFCLNHFIAEDYLEVRFKNMYTAMEIATLQPLHNAEFLVRYWRHNPWIQEFLPNVTLSVPESKTPDFVRFLQGVFELPFAGRFGDWLDNRLRILWKKTWTVRYPDYSEEKRNELFLCEPGISTAYGGDFLTRILDRYHRRLKEYGLDNDQLHG